MHLLSNLLQNSSGLLFTIVALGILVGRLPLGKFRLGGSGVLLVALIFGHYGYILPKEIQTIGVVMFVYAIGLQSGPYIVESIKKSRGSFVILALVIACSAVLTALILKHIFNLSPRMIVGVFAGSMTSTPALAAAIEALGESTASVGYGLAYPFGILGVIALVQILPKILKISFKQEEEKYTQEMKTLPILRKVFEVTNVNATNIALFDLLKEIHGNFRVVRLKRGDAIMTPYQDQALQLGDLVLAVGRESDCAQLRIIFGKESDEVVPYSEGAASRWMQITSKKILGREIGELEISALYGVIMTRVRRGNFEFSPTAHFVLEAGDEVRVSGTPADLQRFEEIVKKDAGSVHETDFFSFALGLALGVLAGLIRVPVTENLTLSLGIAGGPLIVGLIFGHFGRFGTLCGRMPKAAMLLIGELGLYLFLAVAGCKAGISFVHVLKDEGLFLILCGVLITVIPILCAILVGHFILRTNFLILLGMICGGMTSTPAIGVLTNHTKSEVPALGYTGIYPLAVLLTTLAAQIIVLF